ncbi:36391_t:CDS:1, partial [Gigaspora margarita]
PNGNRDQINKTQNNNQELFHGIKLRKRFITWKRYQLLSNRAIIATIFINSLSL